MIVRNRTIDPPAPSVAARRLYDAECALHAAHQSNLDEWIARASDRLHETLEAYLATLVAASRR